MSAASPTPGLLFISCGGATRPVSDLIGRSFNSIGSSDDGVLAACEDGLFCCSTVKDPSQSELSVSSISASEFDIISAGKGFHLAINREGVMYSWGTGVSGQLGHGACYQEISEPRAIKHNSDFTAVSSGESFSIALDDKGNAYSWGENFDRQLGLYTKQQENMHIRNAMIEDLSFAPRLLPLSARNKLTKVACGQRFVVAMDGSGRLFSWGAGECGQLGTGRCTRRELPVPLTWGDANATATKEMTQATHHPAGLGDTDSKGGGGEAEGRGQPLLATDVACGAGHVVAVGSRDGQLYCWGLNKSGQLGLGDTATRHIPVQMSAQSWLPSIDAAAASAEDVGVPVVKFEKVFAHGNSSAALDTNGRLYTWGSTAHNRLMHPLPLRAPPDTLQQQQQKLQALQAVEMRGMGTLSRNAAAAAAEAAEAAVQAKLRPLPMLARPVRVETEHLAAGVRVGSFAFGRDCSAALVRTSLYKVYPTEGPRRSFSQLQLIGDGFWDTPSIVVKFSYVGPAAMADALVGGAGSGGSAASRAVAVSALNPPRSCAGRYVSPGLVVCKPPKFADVGCYRVSISMDGSRFLSCAAHVTVHKELSVQRQAPDLFDLSASSVIPKLSLRVAGLGMGAGSGQGGAGERDYFVKLTFCKQVGTARPGTASSAAASGGDLEVVVKGQVVHGQEEGEAQNQSPSSASGVSGGSEAAAGSAGPAQSDICTIQCCDVNIGAVLQREQSGKGAVSVDAADAADADNGCLYEMRCSVSLNGQDFSSSSSKAPSKSAAAIGAGEAGAGVDAGAEGHSLPACTLLYRWVASALAPCCSPLDALLPADLRLESASFDSRGSGADGHDPAAASCAEVPLLLRGGGFLPSHRLPRGLQLEVRLRTIGEKEAGESASRGRDRNMQQQACTGLVVSKGGSVLSAEVLRAARLPEALSSLPPLVMPARCSSVDTVALSVSGSALLPLQRLISDTLSGVGVGAAQASDREKQVDGAEVVTVESLSLRCDFYLTATTAALAEAKRQGLPPPPKETRLFPPAGGTGTPLELALYRSQALTVLPSCCRATHAAAAASLLDGIDASEDGAGAVGEAGGEGSADVDAVEHTEQRLCVLQRNGLGFGFSSADVRVHIHIPVASAAGEDGAVEEAAGVAGASGCEEGTMPPPCYPALALPASAVTMHPLPEITAVAGEQSQQYWLEVALGPLAHYLQQVGAPNPTSMYLPYAFLSVALDGSTVPVPQQWSRLSFFRSLGRYSVVSPAAAPPKGGFPAGTAITLQLLDFCAPPCPAAAATVEAAIEATLKTDEKTNGPRESQEEVEDAAPREEDGLEGCEEGGVKEGGGVSAPPTVPPSVPLPHPQRCVVRIRGAPSGEAENGACVTCPGQLSCAPAAGSDDAGSQAAADEEDEASALRLVSLVTFSVPSGVAAVPGMVGVSGAGKAKEKFYYVDISVDGGITFDAAESALLAIK